MRRRRAPSASPSRPRRSPLPWGSDGFGIAKPRVLLSLLITSPLPGSIRLKTHSSPSRRALVIFASQNEQVLRWQRRTWRTACASSTVLRGYEKRFKDLATRASHKRQRSQTRDTRTYRLGTTRSSPPLEAMGSSSARIPLHRLHREQQPSR